MSSEDGVDEVGVVCETRNRRSAFVLDFGSKEFKSPLTAKLMEYNRVERFQHIVDQSRMSFVLEQERWTRERREELDQPRRSLNSQILEVRSDVGDGNGKSWEEGVES